MLRFAPRYGIVSPCLVRPGERAPLLAANDNPRRDRLDDAIFEAALRLFANHGLAAAAQACTEADLAESAGDRAGAAWWLEVCRILDRRMARAYRKHHARPR